MKFLEEKLQPKPYYKERNKFVGKINIKDGLIDVTDPCYDSDCWCAIFNKQVKKGKYHCFVDVVNFPYKHIVENESEAFTYKANIGDIITSDDYRIMSLVAIHEDYLETSDSKKWSVANTNIGVDAGLCGFYNHKPKFDEENSWDNFWQNTKTLKNYNSTCDIKKYGITVSSGFGDGVYKLSQKKLDREIVALKIDFND